MKELIRLCKSIKNIYSFYNFSFTNTYGNPYLHYLGYNEHYETEAIVFSWSSVMDGEKVLRSFALRKNNHWQDTDKISWDENGKLVEE